MKLAKAASSVKLVTGVANNAAILVMLDAHDKVKQHPRYRHAVKRAFRDALEARHAYERQLLYTDTNRFFHVADMTADSRKIYGADLTDQQYFEFWQSLAGPVYTKSRPFITSLWNKYRLSLINHGIAYPDLLAWPMVATACLRLAEKIFRNILEQIIADYELPRLLVGRIFHDFSLETVCYAWQKAMILLDDTRYELDETENKNISVGIQQIIEIWANPANYYDSTTATIQDFEEIFRTRGEMKKALRNVSEVREAVAEEMRK